MHYPELINCKATPIWSLRVGKTNFSDVTGVVCARRLECIKAAFIVVTAGRGRNERLEEGVLIGAIVDVDSTKDHFPFQFGK